MDIQISDEQIGQLAKAIARAQLTAADDYIEEATANWLPEHRNQIKDVGYDGQTQAQRFEQFRAVRPQADGAVVRANEAKARTTAVIKKMNEDNAARAAAFDEQEALRFKADTARYEADLHVARVNGKPEPQAPTPVRTLDEVQREGARAAYQI
jgi:hypothetical protein